MSCIYCLLIVCIVIGQTNSNISIIVLSYSKLKSSRWKSASLQRAHLNKFPGLGYNTNIIASYIFFSESNYSEKDAWHRFSFASLQHKCVGTMVTSFVSGDQYVSLNNSCNILWSWMLNKWNKTVLTNFEWDGNVQDVHHCKKKVGCIGCSLEPRTWLWHVTCWLRHARTFSWITEGFQTVLGLG